VILTLVAMPLFAAGCGGRTPLPLDDAGQTTGDESATDGGLFRDASAGWDRTAGGDLPSAIDHHALPDRPLPPDSRRPRRDSLVPPLPDSGSAGTTCAQMVMCALGCGTDFGCIGQCLAQSSPEARQKAWDVIQCVGANCWSVGLDQQKLIECALTKCPAEVLACGGLGT
jgi:hypothetical protein